MNRELGERRVSEYMNRAAPVLSRRTTVHDALRLVRGHGHSALPVCERGRFLGLVGEKELLEMTPSQATLFSRHEMAALLDKVTVGAVVKVPPVSVSQDQSLREAAEAAKRYMLGILQEMAPHVSPADVQVEWHDWVLVRDGQPQITLVHSPGSPAAKEAAQQLSEQLRRCCGVTLAVRGAPGEPCWG